jgi:hypothetical protein
MEATATAALQGPWNKGKLVGQKAPLKVKDIWAIRVRLQIQARTRDLALFDPGIDSKLRGCDLVKLRVGDVCHGNRAAPRAIVLQQKRIGQCNSRSRLRREMPSRHGSSLQDCEQTTSCSQADCMRHHISARGSTRVLSTAGEGDRS